MARELAPAGLRSSPPAFLLTPPNPMIQNTTYPWNSPQNPRTLRPTFARPTPRTDKADHFLTKSHSRPQEPDVRFEGW